MRAAAVGFVALLIYLLTLAPDLTWANFGGDGGELITAAVTLGVPHPPGYPVYVLLGKLVSYLPIGTIAYRFNLFSAASMATAVAFLAATHLPVQTNNSVSGRTTIAAGAAALLFTWSPLVWSQAVIAEVYALHLAFLASLLWALLGGRSPWLVGLLLGLSLTSHLTALLMVPLVFLLTKPYRWPQLVVGTLLGLSPFLAIPLLAQSGSPVRWGEPTTLAGWWWLVSGRLYSSNVFALPLPELPVRLVEWAPIFLRQLGSAGWLVLLLSLWQGARQAPARIRAESLPIGHLVILRQPQDRLLSPCHLVTLTALAYLFYALTYTSADAILFSLPALLLLSLLLQPGLALLSRWALVLPVVALAVNFSLLMNNADVPVRARAEQLLQDTPPSALLLTKGDPAIFSLWYFHHVERRRPDLRLVDSNLLAFDWYRRQLMLRYPDLSALERDDLDRFQAANSRLRPLCWVTADLQLEQCRDNRR